jgi:hypothetical protein
MFFFDMLQAHTCVVANTQTTFVITLRTTTNVVFMSQVFFCSDASRCPQYIIHAMLFPDDMMRLLKICCMYIHFSLLHECVSKGGVFSNVFDMP